MNFPKLKCFTTPKHFLRKLTTLNFLCTEKTNTFWNVTEVIENRKKTPEFRKIVNLQHQEKYSYKFNLSYRQFNHQPSLYLLTYMSINFRCSLVINLMYKQLISGHFQKCPHYILELLRQTFVDQQQNYFLLWQMNPVH